MLYNIKYNNYNRRIRAKMKVQISSDSPSSRVTMYLVVVLYYIILYWRYFVLHYYINVHYYNIEMCSAY